MASRICGWLASRSARSASAAAARLVVERAEAQRELVANDEIRVVERRRATRAACRPGIAENASLARKACARTSGCGSRNAARTISASIACNVSSAASACTRTLGFCAEVASFRTAGTASLRLALVEQALRGVALPAVRAVERGGQRGVVQLREIGNRAQFRAGGEDAIDAALVGARAHVEAAERFRGDPLRMLEHEAVEIRDVERAIRPGLEKHRAEPRILAGEKFRGPVRRPRDG